MVTRRSKHEADVTTVVVAPSATVDPHLLVDREALVLDPGVNESTESYEASEALRKCSAQPIGLLTKAGEGLQKHNLPKPKQSPPLIGRLLEIRNLILVQVESHRKDLEAIDRSIELLKNQEESADARQRA
jgi:hypothetical protein